MIKFSEYIAEAAEEEKGKALKHLTHVEDNVIHNGHEGVGVADHHLQSVHQALLGKNSPVHVSTKWDGAPSVVFGNHPQNGKFFVASKSAFNKNPKINHTPEDIEKNHGHAPGLVDKLKAALEHLPKIMPREGGVYQGDLLHTSGDATNKNGQTSITPNTITYSAPNGSDEAEAMKKKLGIVVHTKYSGRGGLENMTAGPLDAKTRKAFGSNHDVNNVDPTIHVNPSNYTPEEQKAFVQHMDNARLAYGKMKPEAMDAIAGHGVGIETHINDMVRKGGKPSVQGYMESLTNRHNNDVSKLKNPKIIDARNQAHAEIAKHVLENQKHFKDALDVHGHMQNAKNVLVNVMAKNNKYQHTVGGIPTNPEGAVVADKFGNMSKFVNRDEFSRMNFLKSSFQKQKAQEDNE